MGGGVVHRRLVRRVGMESAYRVVAWIYPGRRTADPRRVIWYSCRSGMGGMVVATSLNAGQARTAQLPDEALAVTRFWREAGPDSWFKKSDAFDREFRERFLSLHEAAARGDLDGWADSAEGALALLLLLDQFPRNVFRGTARMYETD